MFFLLLDIESEIGCSHTHSWYWILKCQGSLPCQYSRRWQNMTKWDMGMDQYLLIPFLGGWTSIYQLFWCSPGVHGFDPSPYNLQHLTTSYNIEFRDPCGCSICSWLQCTVKSQEKPHSLLLSQRWSAVVMSQDFGILAGWWFGTFFIFPNSWDEIQSDFHIFQRGRSTTNQLALERH